MPGVSSDGVETLRATIVESGALDRPKLRVPDGTAPEGVVRVEADRTTYHAPVEVSLDGDLEVRGLYDNPRMARQRDGDNRLAEWVEAADDNLASIAEDVDG